MPHLEAKIWKTSFWVRYHVKTITSWDGTFTIMNRKLYSGIHTFLRRKGNFKKLENAMQWKGWKYWARLALIFLSYFPESKRRRNEKWEGRGTKTKRRKGEHLPSSFPYIVVFGRHLWKLVLCTQLHLILGRWFNHCWAREKCDHPFLCATSEHFVFFLG